MTAISRFSLGRLMEKRLFPYFTLVDCSKLQTVACDSAWHQLCSFNWARQVSRSAGDYLIERRYAWGSTSCRTVITRLKSPIGAEVGFTLALGAPVS